MRKKSVGGFGGGRVFNGRSQILFRVLNCVIHATANGLADVIFDFFRYFLHLLFGQIYNILKNDRRLEKIDYGNGIISAILNTNEEWNISNDSDYKVRMDFQIPVDGMGTPAVNLETYRQICSNGATALESNFRTKMEIKDNKCNIIQSSNSRYLFEREAPAKNVFRLMNGQWLALKDGTEEINAVVAQSLKLLEQRDMTQNHRRGWSSIRSPENHMSSADPMHNAADITQAPYYQTFGETYRELYIFYTICNRLCWNSALPQCVIFMNRRDVPSRVMAFATPCKVRQNGRKIPGICINLRNCSSITPESFLAVFLHEMTHIWQFAQNRRGGHGCDFYNELSRIGIREIDGVCRNDSPADWVLREAQQNHKDLCLRLRQMMLSTLSQPQGGDVAFFHQQVSA